jgi:hypothetical protein
MLAHIVLFMPRADIAQGDRQRFSDALSRALTAIPSIRRCRIGRRVTYGFSYEQRMRDHYEYAAILDFDDAAGLKEYLEHPAHEELSQQFYATVETSLVYDYELREGSEGIADVLAGL